MSMPSYITLKISGLDFGGKKKFQTENVKVMSECNKFWFFLKSLTT